MSNNAATGTRAGTRVRRIFQYNGTQLEDRPGLSVEEMRKVHAQSYSELLNGTAKLKETRPDGTQVYEYDRALGRKG